MILIFLETSFIATYVFAIFALDTVPYLQSPAQEFVNECEFICPNFQLLYVEYIC